jgi:nucleoside-triphosphatase THEP1
LEYIDNQYPFLFLTGLEGIGKSTALFAVQSYLRLNDKLRVVYIHDVEELIYSSAKLKNEIYFTLHQESKLIEAIKAIESKESQKARRILNEIRDIFELVISHCRTNEKKLIVIIDNYNKIDFFMNSTLEIYREEKEFAMQLNDFFHGLKCDLKIISASSNNDTQQATTKNIK